MRLKRIIKKVLKEIDKYSPKPIFYTIIMSKNEKKLFDKKIKNSKNYLEFGIGGTTFRALQKSKAKVYSIDSSLDWISLMREYWQIRYMEKRRLTMFHVDIGATQDWGFPVGKDSKRLFPNYSSSIFNSINKKIIDTVMVDGRFRVASTLKVILECYTNDNLQILIHDFWNREKYHIVLKYLVTVDQVDTLGVFVLKKDLDLISVKKDYEIYKYIPD